MASVYLLALLLCGVASIDASTSTPVIEWDKFDFLWPSEQRNQDNNPANIQPNFMAVFGKRLFLSLQRASGISATLAWLPVSNNASSRLQPFPSWNLHDYGNCNRIQTARGLEVDPFGRLWLLDDGSTTCPATLWIFNLITNDTIELVHTFPDAIVSRDFGKRLLHDLVVRDSVAYITDVHSKHLVVFSLETKESWSVETQGKKFRAIALAAESNLLYLARHNSRELYSVAQFRAKERNTTLNLVGSWKAEPYRMVIDSENVLFAAFYDRNYISTWNVTEQFKERRLSEEFGIFSGQRSLFCFALDSFGTFWTLIDHGENMKPRFQLQMVAERNISGPERYVSSDRTPNKSPSKDQEFQKPVVEVAACLAEDYHQSRFLNLILICSNVFTFFAMGAVIVWLLLKRKNSKRPETTNTAVERQQVFVLYDEIVKPVPWNPADYGYVTANNVLPPRLFERPREYEEIGLVNPEPVYNEIRPHNVLMDSPTYLKLFPE
ncbi:major royal jelly protein 1-like [Cloeon dipterum]|uniref:major royal jelly protein 1-like n=1 Tax=Cloeon dipterum TaxID=197152 RepID=UPI0032205F5F